MLVFVIVLLRVIALPVPHRLIWIVAAHIQSQKQIVLVLYIHINIGHKVSTVIRVE